MGEGSARPPAGATPEESVRAAHASERGATLASARSGPGTSAPAWPGWAERSGLLVVALALVSAFAIDWLLVPSSYPVAAAYGVPLILAAYLLASPLIVAALGGIALTASIASNVLQTAPTAALAGNNAGLLGIAVFVLHDSA